MPPPLPTADPPVASKKPPQPNEAAEPRYGNNFDPWNSASTGHQRSETRVGLGWRESRNLKTNSQFRAGPDGGPRMADPNKYVQETSGHGYGYGARSSGALAPEQPKKTVIDMLLQPGSMNPKPKPSRAPSKSMPDEEDVSLTAEEKLVARRKAEDDEKEASKGVRRGIFEGCCVYINGSTYPMVSDHRLKQLLAQNGARTSLHLGRRQVTHVILGRPGVVGAGAGGGLAGGKLEREIRRIGGCAVKYVGVEWVLESLRAGKRLPEARFTNLKIARQRQNSVYSTFSNNGAEVLTPPPAAAATDPPLHTP